MKIYDSKTTDFTQLIIDNINSEGGIIEVDITEGHLTISVNTTDNRHWIGPSYDSPDGLPTLVSGVCNFDLEIELWNFDGSEELDFNYDINHNLIYEYLNYV
jgi:hypothetical protein